MHRLSVRGKQEKTEGEIERVTSRISERCREGDKERLVFEEERKLLLKFREGGRTRQMWKLPNTILV